MRLFIIIYSLFLTHQAFGQQLIDKVEAVIGNEIILTSDIEMQYQQSLAEGYTSRDEIRCSVIEDLLYQKILVYQSKIDSLEVTDAEINSELDKRISYFINQIGSKEKLEDFYGRSIIEIRNDLRNLITEQLLSQKMQNKITGEVKVTPNEVKRYYNSFSSLSKDSLLIDTEVELSHIVLVPEISERERKKVIKRLTALKNRVEEGEDFRVLATLYSDDMYSAKNGGELGFLGRSDLVPEFESAAYKLTKNEVSGIVESKFGFHIIQLMERRGERINVRHILLKPKVSFTQLESIKSKTDSILELINSNRMTFEEAVVLFSDDESKNNEGLLINMSSGSSMFLIQDLDSDIYSLIEKMDEGDVSTSIIMHLPDGSKAYRLIKLRKRIMSHIANLKDDYDKIQNATLTTKKQEAINKWLKKKIINTYIRLDTELVSCSFVHNWLIEK